MSGLMDRIKRALSGGGASISVNGVKVRGRVVSGDMLINDKGVFVNGQPISDFEDIKGPINVQIEGSVQSLKVQAGDVTVAGDVGSLDTQAGDVNIKGSVEGDVKSQAGDIEVEGSVKGNVKASCGDVTIGGR